jgi:hypothetical protein
MTAAELAGKRVRLYACGMQMFDAKVSVVPDTDRVALLTWAAGHDFVFIVPREDYPARYLTLADREATLADDGVWELRLS